jgi:hypothetical protein
MSNERIYAFHFFFSSLFPLNSICFLYPWGRQTTVPQAESKGKRDPKSLFRSKSNKRGDFDVLTPKKKNKGECDELPVSEPLLCPSFFPPETSSAPTLCKESGKKKYGPEETAATARREEKEK